MAPYERSDHSSVDSKDHIPIHDPGHEAVVAPPSFPLEKELSRPTQIDIEKAPSSPVPAGPPPGAFDPTQNPDGGRDAWMVVVGGFCVLFCSFGWINTIGIFQAYYQEGPLRTYSPSTIAWIPSLEVFFMLFLGPWVGAILDRYGFRWLLLGGTFFHVFGVMMISLCSEYYQFILAQGICSPIGIAMIFFPAMASVSQWFWKRRAFAFGIMAAGSSLGGVIFPIMVQRLIAEVGFGWSLRICGFLILFLLIIANLTIKERMTPMPKPLVLMEFVHPLKEVPYDLLTFGAFLFFLGFFIPINFIVEEAQYFGMSPDLAQYLVSILNAASFFGRVIPNALADMWGRFNVMIVICFFSGILVLALWIPATGNAPIILFAALFGFGSGAFVSLSPSLVAQISDIRKIGVRTGTYFAITSIATLISNPIGGIIISKWNGGYTGVQIFSGVTCLAGACFITAARIKLVGFDLKKKV